MKLATATIMQGLDRRAINEYGIPGVVLMENAGQGTVRAMQQALGPLRGKIVSIFIGPGNNGGDGFVIARGLHQAGVPVRLFLLVPPEKIRGDALVNWKVVEKLGLSVRIVADENDLAAVSGAIGHSAVVVDAIFGTGLKREVAGVYAAAIRLMNDSGRPVVAVDIPSGLDSDTGQPLGVATRACLTVTYGLAKPGHYSHPGAGLCGRIEVVDIGIPPEVVAEASISTHALTRSMIAPMLPARPADGHKGTFGHLLVTAGAEGKTGAALLAARGGLRAGSGLVSCAVPKGLTTIFESVLLEAMTIPLASQLSFSPDDFAPITAALAGKKAVAAGPGIGTGGQTAELMARLYREVELPMVVDADGLNILAERQAAARHGGHVRILTPHPGEMARLTGRTTGEVQKNRTALAAEFAAANNVYLVLKGAGTVVAAPDGRIAINTTGNPGMGCGGMGDVLCGVIGALLAQGCGPWQAACAAVWLHGRAADRIVETHGVECGFSASEVADELPRAIAEARGSLRVQ